MDLAEKMERLDVVDIIEKEIGKPVSEFTEDEVKVFLKKALQMNGIRSAVQKAIPDTNMHTAFDDVVKLITDSGFEPAVKIARISKQYGWPETEYIFVSKEGLVIYLESFNGNRVNTFTLMGEVYVNHKMADGYTIMDRICCGGGSFGYFTINPDDSNEPLKAYVYADCRTGFSRKLGLMKELGTPIPQWQNPHSHIWLLNYDETKDLHDYNELMNKSRDISLDKIRNSGSSILKRIYHMYI